MSKAWRKKPWMLGVYLGATVAVAPYASAALGAPSVEYQVKAAYLSKLGNFVQWPAGSADADEATICILGNDPFGDFIDHAVQGHKIGDRQIVIRRIDKVTAASASPCQILYLSDTNPKRVEEMMGAVQGQHVLTVGDAHGGDDMSAVVTFVIQNNNVRFEIDQKAAAESGLTISSQLLALAVTVRPAK